MKTVDYLDAISRRYPRANRQGIVAPATDYALAKLLEKNPSSFTHYRNRGVTFDDQTAVKVAELLDIDPAVVMADMHAERAKDKEVKKIWLRVAHSFKPIFALIIIHSLISGSPLYTKGYTAPSAYNYGYYVKL